MHALLLWSLLAAGAPAAPTPGSTSAFNAGTERYRDADFERALPLFQKATGSPDKPERARAELWMGLTFFNLGNSRAARDSFRAALTDDPQVALPDDAPPSAVPLFANVRIELERSAPRPVPPEMQARPAPPPSDVPKAEERPEPSAEDRRSAPGVGEAREGAPVHVPAWAPNVVGGVAAGLGVVAGGLKLASNGKFDDAIRSHSASEAAALSRSADGEQHLARALAFTALGTVVVATVLYVFRG